MQEFRGSALWISAGHLACHKDVPTVGELPVSPL